MIFCMHKTSNTNWIIIATLLVRLIPVVPHKAVAEVSKIGNL